MFTQRQLNLTPERTKRMNSGPQIDCHLELILREELSIENLWSIF